MFKNISYICIWDAKINIEQIKIERKFCKKNNVKFYISNNINLAKFLKADGIHLPSSFKRKIHNINSNMDIIGTAHHRNDCYIKMNQGCKGIFISPLFYNKKYSQNKILNVCKFNLISMNWEKKICALGGINLNNIKKLNMTRSSAAAFMSVMNNNNQKKSPLTISSKWAI